MRGGRSDKSSESGVLGVFEPDRLLAMVGGEVLRDGDSSMLRCDLELFCRWGKS
jgi:hypothetical protein